MSRDTAAVSIPLQRLHSHLLADNPLTTPHGVVAHFGAVQAQDYLGALWGVGQRMKELNAGGGMLNAVVVVNGRVVGNWKRTLRGKEVEVAIAPFGEPSAREKRAVDREAARYAQFIGSRLAV